MVLDSSKTFQFSRLLLFRIALALVLRTDFTPDEHWQSIEVAHRWVFGVGHLTWEWQPCVALRGFLHPSIFALLYAIISALGLDTPYIVAYAPRLLMGVFAAFMDLGVYSITEKLCGPVVARLALVFHLASWFNAFMLIRTYSTSLEAILNVAAAIVWTRNRSLAMLVAGLSVSIRPLGAVFWVAFGLSNLRDAAFTLPTLFLTVPVLALFNFALDSWAYDRWTFVPYNFLKFNLLDDHSALYGTHHRLWYLTEGLTVTLLTYFPFAVTEIVYMFRHRHTQTSNKDRTLQLFTISSLLYTAVLSLGSHKEHRFLLPQHWVFILLAAKCLTRLTAQSSGGKLRHRNLILAFVLGIQVLGAVFFCTIHQQAGDQISAYLRTHNRSVFFLTPCHQFPLHSHRHGNTTMGFLDCSPPLDENMTHRSTWVQRFFKAPTETARLLFENGTLLMETNNLCLPQRVLGPPYPYGTLPEVLILSQSILTEHPDFFHWLSPSYSRKHTIFHALFSDGPYGLETPSYYEIWELEVSRS